MNQLLQPNRPKTVLKEAYAKTAYAFDSALFWLEDNWRPVVGSLSAAMLIAAVCASLSNQTAIDEDVKAVRRAAAVDGIEVESIASGIRAGRVLANIAIGDCSVVDSTLTVNYQNGVLHVDDYTIPVAITAKDALGPQKIHFRNAADLQGLSPLSVVCE